MSTSTRPVPGAPRPYVFPRAVDARLTNGLRVVCVPLSRLPAATLLFTADAGAERDAVLHAGVGSLTAQGLAEGTRDRSANDVAAAFEQLGGELYADAGWVHAECGTTVLRNKVPATMALLADVMRNPRFPDDGIKRLRQERLAELLQQRAEPRGLADDLFAECCFAAGDRYALPGSGSETTVREITAEATQAHYQARYSPRTGLLIVTGDVDADETLNQAEGAFGSWTTPAADPPAAMKSTPRSLRAIHVAHRPEAPQSEIRIGHASVARAHPDFYALSVMNAILGGLFNSRINLNLRERHAYTYGAFSSFDWRRTGGIFEVSTAVKSDTTAPAVQETMHEIERIRAGRVRDDELSLARDYLTGVFPLRFETTAAIADAIAYREGFGLSATYYDEYRSRIAAVALDDVHRVANEHLRPDRMQIVVVGDADAIVRPLEALGLGELRRVEPTT